MAHKQDGWWYASIQHDGNRIREGKFKTKREAEEVESRMRKAIADGQYLSPEQRQLETKLTLEEFYRQDYLPHAAHKNSEQYHAEHQRAFAEHFLPKWGAKRIDAITADEVDKFRTSLRGGAFGAANGYKNAKKRSDARVNRLMAAFGGVMRYAHQKGRIKINPCAGLMQLKETPPKKKLLTLEDIDAVIEAIPDNYKALIETAFLTGMRRTELFELRWDDIDFAQQLITLTPLKEDGSAKHLKSGKQRTINFGSDLKDLLLRHRLAQAGTPDLVFTTTITHAPLKRIHKVLHTAAKKAGLDKIGMHHFRHAFASHHSMNGVAIEVIKEWLGHADIGTTMKYVQSTNEYRQKAAEGLSLKRSSG